MHWVQLLVEMVVMLVLGTASASTTGSASRRLFNWAVLAGNGISAGAWQVVEASAGTAAEARGRDKTGTNARCQNKAGSQGVMFEHLASLKLVDAEGMGFEPTTPCGASDFESYDLVIYTDYQISIAIDSVMACA